MPPSRLARILREPIAHFAMFGTLLAAVVATMKPGRDVVVWDEESEAVVSRSLEAELGRPPTAAERTARRRLAIEREILVREAIRRGLHLRDPVIRRRLLEKMEAILVAEGWDDAAPVGAPSASTPEVPWVKVEVCRLADETARGGEGTDAVGAVPSCVADPRPWPAQEVPLSRFEAAFGAAAAQAVRAAAAAESFGTWRRVPGEPMAVRLESFERRPQAAPDLRTAHKDRAARRAAARAAALERIVERYEVRGVPE